MPLDFPASPITGATYTGPNNVIWVWDGAKWVNGTQIGTAYAPISVPGVHRQPHRAKSLWVTQIRLWLRRRSCPLPWRLRSMTLVVT